IASGNYTAKLGQESQIIEVQGSAVAVNTEQPTVQGVLTTEQIETLPFNGRNFLDLAQLEPGVQIQDGGNFDPTKNGFSSISFGGRYGRTARITLDGIDISDETVGTTTQNISAGAIQEFQLSQSTLDLSTELTSSGAVNVLTRSGTNRVHGQGLYLFRDKRAGMANFPGGKDTAFQRNQMGGSLGGPIIKDRLFFFGNVERIRQPFLVPLSPAPPFQPLPQSYPAKFVETESLGKLDWQIKSNMHLFYRFTYDVNSDVSAFGSTYQPFANRDNTPAHGVGLDFNTGQFTHSVRFGYLKFQNHIADAVTGNPGVFNPAGNIPVAIRIGPAGVVTRFGPSRLAPQATFQSNQQIKYDGSKIWGSHILRYGVSYNKILGGGFAAFYGLAPEARTRNSPSAQADAATGPFSGGASNPLNYRISSILVGNGQGFFTEIPQFGFPAGGQFDDRLGIYLGDSWKVRPNFTLTYGLRYSRDTGRQDSDLPPMTCDQIDASLFNNLVPCTGKSLILDQFGSTGLGGSVRQPNLNLGPQLGFAWNVSSSGKTVIRGGAGLYYENAVFNNILFDRPSRLQKGLFFGTASPCPSGTLALPGGNSVTSINGVDIATGVCGQRVGSVLPLVAALESTLISATKTAGPQANLNFLGNILANGPNSTGNGFIAPSYRTPRSIQMNIGVQRELAPGVVLTADFIRNVGEHYLISLDTNHVGDSRFLNKAAALNAIAATTSGFTGCSGTNAAAINCAIAAGATIDDFAGNGLDSGNNYLSGTPASFNGLTPDTGAAFPGINPLVGENNMLFPIGRSEYNGLQVKLAGNKGSPLRGLSQASYQISYALSRFKSMASDQDFIPEADDFRNPTAFMGPNSLDRTHQISFGGSFHISHGPLLSFASHFYSPLAQDMRIEDQFRGGEIFFSDPIGDGAQINHLLPQTNLGEFGRNVNPGNINSVITNYNNTVAGKLAPAGQALVSAGLFTQAQLVSLGAVMDSIPLAPAGEIGLSWLRTFDAKLAYPIKLRESVTLEPSIGFYNAFNFANFNSPGHLLGSVLNGSQGNINGTTADKPGLPGGKDSVRIGLGTGVNTAGSPRQLEYGLKLTF
ncbi:MAG TPA: TonB-dependent receptor, partial [Terriglobales bacterium]